MCVDAARARNMVRSRGSRDIFVRVFVHQVTWVEHMEIEDRVPIHLLYRDLILSGAAFGAHRWLAALQRACERCACLATAGMPHRDIAAAGGVCVSDELAGMHILVLYVCRLA